jgi:hypothetical protein
VCCFVDPGRFRSFCGRFFSFFHRSLTPLAPRDALFSLYFRRAQITLISHAQLLPTLFGLLAVPSAVDSEPSLDPRRQLCGATALAALLYNQVRGMARAAWRVCGLCVVRHG